MKKAVIAAAGIASVVGLVLASTAPAMAATAGGTVSCGYVYVPHLKIESSANGSGSWQQVPGGAVSYITFFTGTSYKTSPYQGANWQISNGSGYWYSSPYAWCA